MTDVHIQRVHTENVVLDIGEDSGGLVIYVPEALLGKEVEISPTVEGSEKTHTDVTEWHLNGRVAFVAVYPPLPVGEYRVWQPQERAGELLTLHSGTVTELDWR